MVPRLKQIYTKMESTLCVNAPIKMVQTDGLIPVKMLQQKDAAGDLPDAVTIVTRLHFLPTAQLEMQRGRKRDRSFKREGGEHTEILLV